ncbi:hypothetical protein Emag_000711 [Eimeria magna]
MCYIHLHIHPKQNHAAAALAAVAAAAATVAAIAAVAAAAVSEGMHLLQLLMSVGVQQQPPLLLLLLLLLLLSLTSLRIEFPSLVMTIPPMGSNSILSIEEGPKVPEDVFAVYIHLKQPNAQMLAAAATAPFAANGALPAALPAAAADAAVDAAAVDAADAAAAVDKDGASGAHHFDYTSKRLSISSSSSSGSSSSSRQA